MFAWPARIPGDSHIERGSGRILTTHTGSLPRPTDLVNSLIDRDAGKPIDPAALASRVSDAVANVVGRQAEVGIDGWSRSDKSTRAWRSLVNPSRTAI